MKRLGSLDVLLTETARVGPLGTKQAHPSCSTPGAQTLAASYARTEGENEQRGRREKGRRRAINIKLKSKEKRRLATSLYSMHQLILPQASHEHCAGEWGREADLSEHLEMGTQTSWETLLAKGVTIWGTGTGT